MACGLLGTHVSPTPGDHPLLLPESACPSEALRNTFAFIVTLPSTLPTAVDSAASCRLSRVFSSSRILSCASFSSSTTSSSNTVRLYALPAIFLVYYGVSCADYLTSEQKRGTSSAPFLQASSALLVVEAHLLGGLSVQRECTNYIGALLKPGKP
jgi:hypothetical protein